MTAGADGRSAVAGRRRRLAGALALGMLALAAVMLGWRFLGWTVLLPGGCLDDPAAIGKLYRRQDEIGTLYCITVDHQTADDDQQVTIRDRDTMEQVRIPKAEVLGWLRVRVSA